MILPNISFRTRRVSEQLACSVKPVYKLLVLSALCVITATQVYGQAEKRNDTASQAKTIVPTPSPSNAEAELRQLNNKLANVEKSLADAQADKVNWWGNWASIADVFLSLVLAGIGVYLAIRLHKLSGEEARNALVRMLEKIHEAVYELEKIKYVQAIEKVESWSQNDELAGVEWFSPFSAVPLFWHNLADAHKVIEKLASLQKKGIDIKLIGPNENQFISLCGELAQRVTKEDSSKLPVRFSDLLTEVTNAIHAQEASNGEKDSSRRSLEKENDTLVNELVVTMRAQYEVLTSKAKSNLISVQDNNGNVAKLRTGYAYAKFLVTQSVRPNDTCSTIVFSNPEPEECPLVLPSIDNPSLLLESNPIIYLTRNQLVIHGLRGAVDSLLRCP